MYKIPDRDGTWDKWKRDPRNYQVLRSNHLRLKVIADYHDPIDDEVLSQGFLSTVLEQMEKRFRKGLKLSQNVIYNANSLPEFYLRLKQTARNMQDTLIRLPRCRSLPCIRNPKWLRRLRGISLSRPDGMRLRIQTRFHSKDMDKYEFFQQGFVPFLASSLPTKNP